MAAVRFAEPPLDGDIWFHLTYGRYMLENGTLTPDHSVFSWTPADKSRIYCAWMPQIAFYSLYRAFGMGSIFSIRYLVIALFTGLALKFSWGVMRSSPGSVPLVMLIILLGLLMGQAGLLLKAELFSFLFMSLGVFLWFQAKRSYDTRLSRLYIYAIPCLMLVWVNSHGAFIFGVFLLICIAAGELVSWIFRLPSRLIQPLVPHATAALILSLAAVLITPYGWSYPAQLVQTLGSETLSSQVQTVAAYFSIFSPNVTGAHLIEYLAVSLVIFVALVVLSFKRNRHLDPTVLSIGIPFMFLYFKYMRSTYFWAVVFVFTALELLRSASSDSLAAPRRLAAATQVLIAATIVFFSARMTAEAVFSPKVGINAVHFNDPVEEAGFIRDNLQGLRMGNTYNCGSYLAWYLWPGHKVLIDGRYFPYMDWYMEYNEFEYGPDDAYRQAFLEKYRCDFWCLPYDFPRLGFFLGSPDWRLVHYGPKACLFLSGRYAPTGIGHTVSDGVYRTGFNQALVVASFAQASGDLDVAGKILKDLKPSFLWPGQSKALCERLTSLGGAFARHGMDEEAVKVLSRAVALDSGSAEAHLALGNALAAEGRMDKAAGEFEKALRIDPANDLARRNLAAVHTAMKGGISGEAPEAGGALKNDDPGALAKLARSYAGQGEYDRALEVFRRMLEQRPNDPEILYNTACMLSRTGRADESISTLRSALNNGFDRWDLIKSDPDLEPIRGTQGFTALIQGH
jgi:pentatricopeptide repeat protein